ncbi:MULTISPECIES: hypothetical protein [Thermomonospora]|uniref:Biotin synthase auxiliary protein n=1 Tax=Thermomonospora curvata (strain ATCC 19995 / DSM 43183 / JCM 3096 / KCTC 9072 / NBRC 15933 / NCIMB 10081 / Henssen B9) TaxID=471852 RepID=D1ACH5_THECD|nr:MULTISPECIES: hypothetical protein [Thermomonospora]ACY99234.1 hypothetical protein Tcur_3701 [Thermomonospora curvata DSM 43183]PKK12298.1 MAG: hypothetical protein BUE48_018140 [Thermomonospora sp. CIF 1]
METTYCDRCGGPSTGTDPEHERCRAARALEPPRYCTRCARRMVVKVTPGGWTAHCVEHGTLTSA